MKKVITDLHCEYHNEDNLIYIVVEFPDGSEKCIAQIMPENIPSWIEEDNLDNDYEEWYNLALEEAHAQGYYLEGE